MSTVGIKGIAHIKQYTLSFEHHALAEAAYADIGSYIHMCEQNIVDTWHCTAP